jgi:hypothetical protein
MDYNQNYRALPFIVALKTEILCKYLQIGDSTTFANIELDRINRVVFVVLLAYYRRCLGSSRNGSPRYAKSINIITYCPTL